MKQYLYVDFIRTESRNILTIEGHAFNVSGEVHFESGDKSYELDIQEDDVFCVSIPLPKESIKIAAYTGNDRVPLAAGRFSGLTDFISSYTILEGYIVSLSNNILRITEEKAKRIRWLEFLYIIQIILNWKIIYAYKRVIGARSFKEKIIRVAKAPFVVLESIITIPRDIFLRLYFLAAKKHKQKPVWIISDRGMSAGDSGEALFRYIVRREDLDVDIYFAISKRSQDYARLVKIGDILDYGSFNYKVKFLLADKIISSQADEEVINPFLRQSDRFSNLFKFRFIFLQHGVIRNDLSAWLNKYNRNIDTFLTSAQREYDSILKYPYHYRKENIALSGLPRYDYLDSTPKKKLIIAPTYRANLLHKGTDRYGGRKYDSAFKNTSYFKFYNNLINDKKLLEVLKKYGMSGEFYVHPNFASQIVDFEANEIVKVMSYPYDYKRAINEGSLLVSDYSSLMFDFAYLNKPVIYTEFDKREFFATHTYSQGDFFDDEKDGFGEVYYSYDDSIDGIVATIEGGCIMNSKYQQRVTKFFKYNDKNNSKRVLAVINEPKK